MVLWGIGILAGAHWLSRTFVALPMTPTQPALYWGPHQEWRVAAVAGLGNSWLRIYSLKHWKSGLLVSPGYMLYCPIRLHLNTQIQRYQEFQNIKIQAWGSVLNMMPFAQWQATEAIPVHNKHIYHIKIVVVL